jgi:CRISPR-associated endonuclease/helicase Cas3
MKNEIFYAKSNGETIEEHNQKLIDAFESLKNKGFLINWLDENHEKIIREIIYFHDQGKKNPEFQNRMRRVLNLPIIGGIFERIPHEWLSPAFISEEKEKKIKSILSCLNLDRDQFYNFFVFVILSHHHRGYLPDNNKIQSIIDWLNSNYNLGLDYYYDVQNLLNIYNASEDRERWKRYFVYRIRWLGLLQKCDYAASAGIDPEQRYNGDFRNDFGNWLKKKNWQLKEFQQKAGECSNKSILIIASTGMGKTEAAMNWINGDKAFYTLGIRIAVNQMYKRFYEIFKDNVILLHGESSLNYAEFAEDENDYEIKIAKARQLSYPLTVATADQLITSVFKFPGFEMVYLTASYSKIIIDEIQSFSPASIAAIVVFLKEITLLGGKFMLMTATLPPFVQKEFEGMSDVVFLGSLLDLKRHRLKLISQEINSGETLKIINENKNKKILIICNTVKKAQKLYDFLKENNFEANLLHSRFIGIHRKWKERQIMLAKAPCIWITTQVVEASLDIDFDLLLTEHASIEALLQRFGRCYRKREYTLNEPNIYIFQAEPSRIYDPYLFQKSWEVLEEYDNKLLCEEDKQKMIEKIFLDIEHTNYFNEYKRKKDLLELGYRSENRNQAEEDFREIINNYSVIPIPMYNLYRDKILKILSFIEDLNKPKLERIKMQGKLNNYLIPVQIFGNNRRLLRCIEQSKYCKKHNIMLMEGVSYSFEKGLEFVNLQEEDNII